MGATITGRATFDTSLDYTLTGAWVFHQDSDMVPIYIEAHSGSMFASNLMTVYDADTAQQLLAIEADGALRVQGSIACTTLNITFGAFNLALACALTGNRTITFPNATGIVCLLTSAQNLQSKTLLTSNVIVCADVVGTTFQCATASSQQLRFDLREIGWNTTRVAIWPDADGHVLLDGGVLTYDDDVLTYDGDVLTY